MQSLLRSGSGNFCAALAVSFAHEWELPRDKHPAIHLRTAIAKVACRRLQPGLINMLRREFCIVQVLGIPDTIKVLM